MSMERIELLRARIDLYRRYLREGAEGDMASAYLWLIRKDEIELAAIFSSDKMSEPKAARLRTAHAAPSKKITR
jgi:hypothetical protein